MIGIAFAALLGLVTPLGLVAQLEGSPGPVPIPSPAPSVEAAQDRASSACATTSTSPALEDAFATPVDQVPILAFLGRLQALPPRSQRALFDGVVALARGRPSVLDGVFGYCVPAAALAASDRALTIVTRTWSLPERTDAAKYADFADGLRAAIAAQMLGDAVPQPLRTRVLAPLLAVDPGIFAVPADPSEEDDLCLDGTRPSRTLATYDPPYPDVAKRSNTTGAIDVRVYLDRFGLATAFEVSSSTAPQTPAGRALVREALVSAALSTYVQACSGSDASADVYLFHVRFTGAPRAPQNAPSAGPA